MTSSSGPTLKELFKGENRPNMFVKSPKRQTSHLDMLKRCFSQDYKSELEFLGGKLATLCYCGAFLSFGMSEAVIGPTLLELGCQTGKGVNRIAWIVFTQAFSAWFGSLTGGLLAERYNCSRVLVTNVLAISICLAFIPVWSIYYGMLITVGLLGINMGMIDTVANVNLIKIHGREVAPRLQALHFCYGMGALLSPMIVRPFLRDQCDGTVVVHNSTNSTIERNRTILNTTTVYKVSKEPITVQFGYWIIASIQIPIILGLVYLIFKQKRLRETFPVPNEGEIISLGDNDSESTSEAMKDLSQIFKPVSLLPAKRPWITISVRVLLITFLSSSLLFLCEGLKGSYAGYLYTFALKSKVHLTSREGAFLSALFWGHFAVGRFISIPVAIFIKPDKMVCINLECIPLQQRLVDTTKVSVITVGILHREILRFEGFVGCLVSTSVVLYFHDKALAIYIGTSLFGLFLSSVFPSTLALAELYINVTGPVTSVIVIGSASGEMVIPMIVGKLFVKAGPIYFLVVGLVTCILALMMYFALQWSSNVAPDVSATSLLRNIYNTLCQCKNFRRRSSDKKYEYTQLLPTLVEMSSASTSMESTEQGTEDSTSTLVAKSNSLTSVASIDE